MDNFTDLPVYYKTLDFLGCADHCVGTDGSVWSRRKSGKGVNTVGKWKRIKTSFSGPERNYEQVNMTINYKQIKWKVHRLILTAFIGPCPKGMVGCHNDGDTRNNRLDNLRWDTRSSNEKDKESHGTKAIGSRVGSAVLTEELVECICQALCDGMTRKQICLCLRVSSGTIQAIASGRSWIHVTKKYRIRLNAIKKWATNGGMNSRSLEEIKERLENVKKKNKKSVVVEDEE